MRRLVLPLALLCVACTAPVEHGTVKDRGFTPAHYSDWVQPIVTCVPSGKSQICTTVYIPHHDFIADAWTVTITNGDDSDWYSVSSDTFDTCQIGSRADVNNEQVNCTLG